MAFGVVDAALSKFSIAIVGSGPSGLYLADQLLKKRKDIAIDIFERLPVPFGLVRYGVAPDHPEVKSVEIRFLRMFNDYEGRIRFLGNVNVNGGANNKVTIEALRQAYSAVAIATGADRNRELNIPHCYLKNIFFAREFVNYYNKFPMTAEIFTEGISRVTEEKSAIDTMPPTTMGPSSPFSKKPLFDISKVKDVVIIGNGNVALDMARILSCPSQAHWASTDINYDALLWLKQNAVRRINIIARRGPEHAAFTIAEFRELTQMALGMVDVAVEPFSLETAIALSDGTRARKRLLELVHKFCKNTSFFSSHFSSVVSQRSTVAEVVNAAWIASDKNKKKIICFFFNRKPVQFLPSATDAESVGGVEFLRNINMTTAVPLLDITTSPVVINHAITNELPSAIGQAQHPQQQKTVTETVHIPADLVLTSIGYKSSPIFGVPLSEEGIIPHLKGRVILPSQPSLSNGRDDVGWRDVLNVPNKASSHENNGYNRAIIDTDIEKAEGMSGENQEGTEGGLYVTGWVKKGPKGVILHALHDAQETAMSIIEDIEKGIIKEKDGQKTRAWVSLMEYLAKKDKEVVTITDVKNILQVEIEEGTKLSKRFEKMGSVHEMLIAARKRLK